MWIFLPYFDLRAFGTLTVMSEVDFLSMTFISEKKLPSLPALP